MQVTGSGSGFLTVAQCAHFPEVADLYAFRPPLWS